MHPSLKQQRGGRRWAILLAFALCAALAAIDGIRGEAVVAPEQLHELSLSPATGASPSTNEDDDGDGGLGLAAATGGGILHAPLLQGDASPLLPEDAASAARSAGSEQGSIGGGPPTLVTATEAADEAAAALATVTSTQTPTPTQATSSANDSDTTPDLPSPPAAHHPLDGGEEQHQATNHEVAADASSTSASTPGTSTNTPSATASAAKQLHLQKVVNRFTKAYRNSAKYAIKVQAKSWAEIITSEHDVRSDEEVELAQLEENLLAKHGQHLKTLRDYIHGVGQSLPSSSSSSSSSSSNHGQTIASSTATAKIIGDDKNLIGPQPMKPLIWDEEANINTYLSSLSQYCSRSINATENPNKFHEECWGMLTSLVNDPICTARMDSRYVCNGEEWKQYHKDDDDGKRTGTLLSTPPLEPRRRFTAEQIIQQHLTDDTLNIVIIGAGPVGLFLANALVRMPTATKIRVLIFEKRIEYPGRKKQYTRNWMTSINFDTLDGLIDSRITEYLDMIVRDEDGKDDVDYTEEEEENDDDDDDTWASTIRYASIPINAIETLLLLANRDAGVKFLYDNFQDYRDVLETVPNLVVFDATGHRLDSLDLKGKREDMRDHEAAVDVTVSEWPTELEWDIDGKEYDKTKFRYDNIVAKQVTAQGSVMYPVHLDGTPLKYRAFDMGGFSEGSKVGGIYDQWHQHDVMDYMSSNHPLCTTETEWQYYDDYEYDHESDCFNTCRLAKFYEQSTYLRPDIQQLAQVIDPPFEVTGLTVSISDEQYDVLDYIFSSPLPPTWSTDSSVRLASLPIEQMMHTPIFRKNNLIQLLAFLMTNTENRADETALADIFTYIPFVYTDAVVPITAKDHPGRIGTAPLLRVGDSLFSGNPDLATGMNLAFRCIYNFIAEIEFGQLDGF